MPEIFALSLTKLTQALGLRENLARELDDDVKMVIDISRFLDTGLALTTPGSIPSPPFSQNIGIPNPAAGADFTFTAPVGVSWRIKYISGILSTSAVVATRQPRFTFTDPFPIPLGITGEHSQAASLIVTYLWYPGANFLDGSGLPLLVKVQPIPDIILSGGNIIASLTQNLQAGDTWTAIGIMVEVLR
jgi:hypothetical protein